MQENEALAARLASAAAAAADDDDDSARLAARAPLQGPKLVGLQLWRHADAVCCILGQAPCLILYAPCSVAVLLEYG